MNPRPADLLVYMIFMPEHTSPPLLAVLFPLPAELRRLSFNSFVGIFMYVDISLSLFFSLLLWGFLFKCLYVSLNSLLWGFFSNLISVFVYLKLRLNMCGMIRVFLCVYMGCVGFAVSGGFCVVLLRLLVLLLLVVFVLLGVIGLLLRLWICG